VSMQHLPEAGGEAITKQVLRISLMRLIQLSSELGRDRAGDRVPLRDRAAGSVVVPIRQPAGASLPPLVLIHPVGGSVLAN
jgi:hypothetical protein